MQLYLIIAAAVFVLIFFFCSYRKVPKNRIGIRVGPFGNKTVTGKAIFVIPSFFQLRTLDTHDPLSDCLALAKTRHV